MRKVIFIFSMIIMSFLLVLLLIAFVLHSSGVTGAVGISPQFRGYIARVISETGKSEIFKIPEIPYLELVQVNNFWDFILNVGKVIVNLFATPINLLVKVWNTVVTVLTFTVKLIYLFVEIKPEVFEIDDNAWWWRNLAIC